MRLMTLACAVLMLAASADSAQERGIRVRATTDLARKASTTPIVIATRPKDAPAGALAALLLEVPDLEKAIETVKASGGTLLRPPNRTAGLIYAFVKDPDGNQIELLMPQK